MTDTEVKINDHIAGDIHQGSFYRFKYNITDLVDFKSDNVLEVKVAKQSGNISVNNAERFADYWIFGGIYRPVYLEAFPLKHIERFALDAEADGKISADFYLRNAVRGDRLSMEVFDPETGKVGSFSKKLTSVNQDKVTISGHISNVKTWSPEFPNLYKVKLSIFDPVKETSFSISEQTGFRTVELKKHDGIYLNSQKIKFRGICRHSHWPESGRTTNKEISLTDVKLMKKMNLNAVRMSHYPPDEHFLDACDSLGLMVIDELAGWGEAYDTDVGTKLVKEMIAKDVNHPSIVLWSNGNEEGWNPDLNKYFKDLDPQKRPLILTSVIYNGMDTQHYEDFDYGNGTHQHGREIVFPTEFLHAQFDGGGGAGLEDFWNQMYDNPLCAGGFLWSFADEAIVRTDLNGSLDHDNNHAADGVVGPHREKEGSFFAIRELFSPVHFERKYITPAFNGKFIIENRFSFTNLLDCKFSYAFVKLPFSSVHEKKVFFSGKIKSPDIPPYAKGVLSFDLPENWQHADVLYITAKDPHNNELFTWSWPVHEAREVAEAIASDHPVKCNNSLLETDCCFILRSNQVKVFFNKNTGMIQKVENGNTRIPFDNGPKLINGDTQFKEIEIKKEKNTITLNVKFESGRNLFTGNYKYINWTLLENGWLKMETEYWPRDSSNYIGVTFDFPESEMKRLRFAGFGPYRVWKNRLKGGLFSIWDKTYNNTITGENYNYPEFKGFYKDFYWAQINMPNHQNFDILCASNDIFLRVLTPEKPPTRYNDNSAPDFPEGNISFLQGISPVGTKFKKADRLGPMSQKNYFKHYRTFSKKLTLYFNFSDQIKN